MMYIVRSPHYCRRYSVNYGVNSNKSTGMHYMGYLYVHFSGKGCNGCTPTQREFQNRIEKKDLACCGLRQRAFFVSELGKVISIFQILVKTALNTLIT